MRSGSIRRGVRNRLRWLKRRGYYSSRRLFLGGYYRLVHLNYERRWIAPRKRTPAGTVRSYELYNRHGRDAMLAELDGHCDPDAVVFDVGANVGVYALALAAGRPDRRVVAFEPAPSVAEQLRANVRLNDLEDRIDVRPTGLGDEAGDRPFYVSTYAELSAFDRESASRWEASVADVRPVPVERLDAVVEAGPTPDVVKIDVEGAAPAVLRGGRETLATHRPTVFLEIHEKGLDGDEPDECRETLTDIGYGVRDRGDYWLAEPLETDR